MTEEKRYFFKCLSCDATDHGTPRLGFEVVDCPSCGGSVQKWEALPNLSREWAFCQTHGHDWQASRTNPLEESCSVCADHRSFAAR